MSTPSASSTPSKRHRDGNWRESYPSPHSYDYDSAPPSYAQDRIHPSHQGTYFGPPPNRYPPPHEYWTYEYRGGYWGAPSHYDNLPPTENHMPPPSRVPRITTPGRPRSHHTSPHEEQSYSAHARVPGSPDSLYSRGGPVFPSTRGDMYRPGAINYSPQNLGKEKKKGDPLSILANVSAGMTGRDGQKKQATGANNHRHHLPLPAPTSPLQRRPRPSPITPNQTPLESNLRSRHQVTPNSASNRHDAPKGWDQYEPAYSVDYSQPMPYSQRRRLVPPSDYGFSGDDGAMPALVERGSFDSQGESNAYRDGYYHPTTPPMRRHHYDDHAHPHGSYWENASPHPPHGPYPPPRWGYGHPDPYYQDYAFDVHDDPNTHNRGPLPVTPLHTAPYTYVQQPRLEEKTILRKKFSWKHYPELERFLIANRDEYLKHSSMNYTAEQKQYNNWLTERLLEVAARHHYVFDPDDFNFVAIRDRIRCYYKSYVQTARKRGIKLPEKKKD